MALSVADILRWDSQAARDVAQATTVRAMAAAEIADGLWRVPAFAAWQGHGADAAYTATTRLHVDLNAFHDELMRVGRAATVAADEIAKVHMDLRALETDAEAMDMRVEPASSRVVPGPRFHGTAAELTANLIELEPRLAAIQAEAALVDEQFASAIAAAGTGRPQSGVRAVDFKKGPQIPNPGTPDDPISRDTDPTGSDIARSTRDLPQGTKPNIKLVQTQQQLEDLYKWATQNGTAIADPYGPNPGTAYMLPDGTRIGMRQAADSTKLPVIDISYPGKDWEKIHVNPTEGGAPEIPGARAGVPPEAPLPRAPASVEPPPVKGPPTIGGIPIAGAPGAPVGPTLVPPPHSIHHLPVLGEDDIGAPWEYE